MKNFLKKNKIIIILAVFLLFLLAACGNDEKSTNGSDKVNSDKEETETTDKGNESDYPDDTIEIIIPFGGGGDTTRNIRMMVPYLEKELGESLVVTNVEGA